MKLIERAFSNINLKRLENNSPNRYKKTTNKQIRRSTPLLVTKFDELVRNISHLYFHNHDYSLFFRGQSKEHYQPKTKLTTLYPKIYRNLVSGKELNSRYKKLEDLSKEFYQYLSKSLWWVPEGLRNFRYYKEITWAIMQHYGVNENGTPTLDLTSSLHVACSFAFLREKDKTKYELANNGIIYVLGLPNPTDRISYSTRSEIFNVDLHTIGSTDAERPIFQNGYMVGPYPISEIDNMKRRKLFDFSKRLLAKFEIRNNGKFWSNGYDQIPASLLYPEGDPFYKVCSNFIYKNTSN